MENESKWYSNEPSHGNVTYAVADSITNFCFINGITLRGHAIFWAVDQYVQPWVQNLSNPALTNAISNRLNSAVNHFKGTFVHWDVNNEMLHGNFYGNRLGNGINPWMFQRARALDPNVKLFVNDYNVVAGNETCLFRLLRRECPNGVFVLPKVRSRYSAVVHSVFPDTPQDALLARIVQRSTRKFINRDSLD